jgi:hypothetical protein
MVKPYEFTVIDADQPVLRIFAELRRRISRFLPRDSRRRRPSRTAVKAAI